MQPAKMTNTDKVKGMTDNLIYSRGFPYGAPLALIRGGATKQPEIRALLKQEGFQWDSGIHAWKSYKDRTDFGALLRVLRDEYDCNVMPKDSMDHSYRIDLDAPEFGSPE
jgi:hypothetical protein